MLRKNILRKLVTSINLAAVWCVYSMVAFGGPVVNAGDITVKGQVIVNGQAAVSNSLIMSGSTITTGEGSSAVVSLGKTGRIEIEPKTTFVLSFDSSLISGNLDAGSVTVLNSTQSVKVKIPNGEMVALNAGETASSVAGKAAVRDHRDSTGKCIDDNNDGKADCDDDSHRGVYFLLAAVVGVGVAIAILASRSNNDNLGGSAIIVSPTR